MSGETPDLHKSLLKSTTLETLVSSLLYQCLFEIGLCIIKEGGMAVSAVLRLVHLLAPYPSEPWYPLPYTKVFRKCDFRRFYGKAGVSPAIERLTHAGETPALHSEVQKQTAFGITQAGRLPPSPKVQKVSAFGIMCKLHSSNVPRLDIRAGGGAHCRFSSGSGFLTLEDKGLRPSFHYRGGRQPFKSYLGGLLCPRTLRLLDGSDIGGLFYRLGDKGFFFRF